MNILHYFGFHHATCHQPLNLPCASPVSSIRSIGSLVCQLMLLTSHTCFLLGKTHLSILSGETSLGRLGVEVLLLDVSVKMEIIGFLQQRIKQKLRESIIITLQRCTIRIDYVQPSHHRSREGCLEHVSAQAHLPWTRQSGPRSDDHLWRLTFLKEGGWGLAETSQGRFSEQNRRVFPYITQNNCQSHQRRKDLTVLHKGFSLRYHQVLFA